jgi:DNA-binding NarL/FixJ family response regulator
VPIQTERSQFRDWPSVLTVVRKARHYAAGPRIGPCPRFGGLFVSTIRVVLVDDHALVRRGVRAWLEEAGDIEVVGEAADGERAIELLAAHRPDVLVTDIEMPGMNGLDLTRRVVLEYPDTKVLILSIHKQKEYATKALASGAKGYLLKDAGEGECEAAVRAVFRGESYLSPAVSAHLVAEYTRLAQAEEQSVVSLTPRQREVLQLIAEGLPTKAIAKRLSISAKTVDVHRSQLMERLDIHDVAHLVRYAIRNHLIEADE